MYKSKYFTCIFLSCVRHMQRHCNCGEVVSDCFAPPIHSHLRLYGPSGPNQLVCVPITPQARAALFCSYGCALQGQEENCFYGSCSYTGPATCISCEAGKFSTASSPRCSTVCKHSVHVSLVGYRCHECMMLLLPGQSSVLCVMPLVLLRTKEVSSRLRTPFDVSPTVSFTALD